MPVIKAIFLKHVFHHFIFCLLLLLYRDSMILSVEIQVDFYGSTQERMNWFYLPKQIQNLYDDFREKLSCEINVQVKNKLITWLYLVLTTRAYRIKLRNDGMTKGIQLPCRRQNHLSNIGFWEQQNDIDKKKLFERVRKRKYNQIKRKSDWEVHEGYNLLKKIGLMQ